MGKANKNLTQERKQKFIEVYEECLCNVSVACKRMGLARSAYYEWMKEDKDFRKAIEDATEVQVDFVENALMKQIKEGNPTSTIFFLKCKGKKRGYIDRQEVDITSDKKIEFKLGE